MKKSAGRRKSAGTPQRRPPRLLLATEGRSSPRVGGELRVRCDRSHASTSTSRTPASPPPRACPPSDRRLSGFFRKSWRIVNISSPPNGSACRSDRSKRNVSALASAVAVVLQDLVRIDVRVDVLVRRREPAALHPDLGRLRGREVLDEGLRRRVVLEHHDHVAAADDRRLGAVDRREVVDVEVRLGLRLRLVEDHARRRSRPRRPSRPSAGSGSRTRWSPTSGSPPGARRSSRRRCCRCRRRPSAARSACP